MYIQKLSPNVETSYIVSRLLYEPHIYQGQDDRMKDVWWVHRFFSEIEEGKRLVFAAFDENNTCIGVAHGTIEAECFIAHTMFKRKVDAVKACLLMEDELKKYCIENNIIVKAVVGYPPEELRVAIIMNKRFGCKDMGKAMNVEYWRNGKNIPCRYMRKEI